MVERADRTLVISSVRTKWTAPLDLGSHPIFAGPKYDDSPGLHRGVGLSSF